MVVVMIRAMQAVVVVPVVVGSKTSEVADEAPDLFIRPTTRIVYRQLVLIPHLLNLWGLSLTTSLLPTTIPPLMTAGIHHTAPPIADRDLQDYVLSPSLDHAKYQLPHPTSKYLQCSLVPTSTAATL
jgi:hypothetical protein